MSPPSCNTALQNTMSGPEFCGQLVAPHGVFEYERVPEGLGTQSSMARGGRFCPLLPSDQFSLFRACLPHLRASSFFKSCTFDMCNFQGLQHMLCAHMSALTENCQDAGYTVKPWRGPQFCRELFREAGPPPSDADAT